MITRLEFLVFIELKESAKWLKILDLYYAFSCALSEKYIINWVVCLIMWEYPVCQWVRPVVIVSSIWKVKFGFLAENTLCTLSQSITTNLLKMISRIFFKATTNMSVVCQISGETSSIHPNLRPLSHRTGGFIRAALWATSEAGTLINGIRLYCRGGEPAGNP